MKLDNKIQILTQATCVQLCLTIPKLPRNISLEVAKYVTP